MKLLSCLFLILLAYPSVSQTAPIQKNGYVVLPYDAAHPVMKALFTEKVKKADLDKRELEQVDTLLKKCINDYNMLEEIQFQKWQELDSSTARNEFFINLATYQKQYVPVTNERGQKIVWVNAFCYVAGDTWQKELVKEDDGGKCFFNVKINLVTRMIYNLSINNSE